MLSATTYATYPTTPIFPEENVQDPGVTYNCGPADTNCYITIPPAAETYWQAATTPGDIYYSGGNVGIGTDEPTALLDVSGGLLGGEEVIDNGTFNDNADGWDLGDGGIYDNHNVTVFYTGDNSSSISTGIQVQVGKTYILSFSVSGSTDTVACSFSDLTTPDEYKCDNDGNGFGDGDHSIIFTVQEIPGESSILHFSSWNEDVNTGWTIDNVSLKGVKPLFVVSGNTSNPRFTVSSAGILDVNGGRGITGQVLSTDGEGNLVWTDTSGGGSYIPLSGTDSGSPVTGSIEIAQSNLYPLRKTFVGPSRTDMTIGIFDNDDPDSSTRGAGLGFIMQGSLVNQAVIQAYSEVSSTSLSIFANNGIDDGVLLTTDLSSRGLYGNAYFGPNYDDFTYVQKKYVDDALDLLSSDERLKKNMTDLPSTLNTLSGVRTVSYNWNTEHDTDPQHIGFIAQDLKNYYPDLVSKQPDGYYKVSYALMTPILTKAIQEINTNITDISNLTTENTWRDSLIAWLGDITNGINRIFAHEVRTDRLCITKADGSDVCLTGEQVEEIVGSDTPAIDSDEPVSEEIPNVPEEEMESDTAAEGSQAPSGDTDGAGEQIRENIPEEVPTDMSVPEESVQEDAVSSETLAVPEIPTL